MMVDGEYRIEANGVAHWVRVAGAQHAGEPPFKVLEADPDTRARFMFHDPAKAAAAAAAASEAPNYGFNEQMARALIGTERPELFDDLADTGLSTLVMIGLWDLNAGVDAARNLALRLPQGSLHLFLHSAHLPHEEEPDEYVAAVHAFTGR